MPLLQNKGTDTQPIVSILMTVYNAGKFLKPAIDSLLAQTFNKFELIIIENGSEDGSRKTIHSYNDPRIRCFDFDKNIGRTPALIKAFEQAKGEFIAVQDADDLSLPQRLELQINHMLNNPKTVLLGTACKIIDEHDQVITEFNPPSNSEDAYQALAFENVICHSSSFYRRDIAKKVGGYPIELAFAQDYGLWIQLAKLGEIANLPQELVLVHEHSQRVTNFSTSLILRSLDVISCLENAQTLPKLTKGSIDILQYRRTTEFGRIAKSNFKMGNFLSGIFWTFKFIQRSPGFIIQRWLKRQKHLATV